MPPAGRPYLGADCAAFLHTLPHPDLDLIPQGRQLFWHNQKGSELMSVKPSPLGNMLHPVGCSESGSWTPGLPALGKSHWGTAVAPSRVQPTLCCCEKGPLAGQRSRRHTRAGDGRLPTGFQDALSVDKPHHGYPRVPVCLEAAPCRGPHPSFP